MFKQAFLGFLTSTTLLASGWVAQASAVILESVPFDSVDTGISGGSAVFDDQFLGWRFELDNPFQVTDIGGTFFGFGFPNQEIFGAIVSLSESDALPLGSPFLQEEVLAVTTFNIPLGHNDILTPLEVSLDPGNYGLVFGGGLFGATGIISAMSSLNGGPLASSGIEYFQWRVDRNPPLRARWSDSGSPNRFVVAGSTLVSDPVSVPETSPVLSLLALGTLAFGSSLLHRKA
ncbi:MAG: hypothetical protein F6K14_08220 [Symploca sp. SIO2C1]|nr:hypothetical protein [Symploca sp. SIO2C1]